MLKSVLRDYNNASIFVSGIVTVTVAAAAAAPNNIKI